MTLSAGTVILLLISFYSTCRGCSPIDTIRQYVEVSDYRNLGGVISSSEQLSCADFRGNCFWTNLPPPSDDLDWVRGRFKRTVTPAQMFAITGKRELPSEDFLVAFSPVQTGGSAVLVGSVPCQRGVGQLSFRYWSNLDKSNLRVCVRQFGYVQCLLEADRKQANPVVVNIPQSEQPFEILIEAFGFSKASFVLIDDLQYSARVCHSQTDGTTPRPPGPPGTPGTPGRPGDCAFLECDFNEGTSCGYRVAGEGSRNGQWNVGSGRVGNPATGISRTNPDDPPQGGYAYIGRDAPLPSSNPIYVLESAPFITTEPATVLFDLYQRSVGPVVQACIDNLDNCFYRNPTLDPSLFWYRQQILNVPPGRHKLLFVARDLRDNLYMAIDNIRFRPDSFNNNICQRV